MDAEDAELVVETAAAPAATTVDQVNVLDSEIFDCELTVTSPAAVNNTLEGLVPQQVIESAEVKHKRAVTMQQVTVTQGIGADSAFVLAHCMCRVKKIVIESAVDSDSTSESEGEEVYEERAWD